eukprot:11366993-Karenia_brevis.AAC.1
MSDEWEVAFQAHETQSMHEVPGSTPYLIESTCLQNATPHMLTEEVHRMCATSPHLQTGGNDNEIKKKICPA